MLGTVGVERPDQMADRILGQYGSIAAFARAEEEDLHTAFGDRGDIAQIFAFARNLIEIGLHEDIARSPIVPGDPALQRYLVHRMGHRREEMMLALLGDRDDRFLAEVLLATGQRDRVSISARTLVGHAMRNDARSVLLVHNHPSGDFRPSKRDISETAALDRLLRPLDLKLIDHLVVAGIAIHSIQGRRTL